MSSKAGFLSMDSLFMGLTRPPMVFGVTYTYALLNLMCSMLYFIATSDFKVVLIAIGMHGIGYLICLREPLLIEMFIIRQAKFRKCRNRLYHKYRNSYNSF